MSTVSLPSAPVRYGLPPPRVRRFTVDEYHRLIEDGYFAADEQFELLEGWIVEKVSRNPPHDSLLNRARRRVERALPAGWMARIQSAVTSADSEPEPDIAVVRGDDADYVARHPGAADTALIVEVSDTTLAEDRSTKLRIYAKARFEPYWIINVVDRAIEVHADPTGPAVAPTYQRRTLFTLDQSVPLHVGGADVGPIPVAELFV